MVSVSFISKTVGSLYMCHNSQGHHAKHHMQSLWTRPYFNHARPCYWLGTPAGFHSLFGTFVWVSSEVIYLSLSLCTSVFRSFLFLVLYIFLSFCLSVELPVYYSGEISLCFAKDNTSRMNRIARIQHLSDVLIIVTMKMVFTILQPSWNLQAS